MEHLSYRTKNIPTRAPIGILISICGAVIVGQIGRIPLNNQGGGLLISDIVLVASLACGVITMLLGIIPLQGALKAPRVYVYTSLPFFLWVFAVLVYREYMLGVHSFLIALLYALRLLAISLLFPLLTCLVSARVAQKAFLWMYYMLIALGYAQLVVFPSLVGNINGWDPHIHRMVATWFDPNFFGAFIAMGILPALYWSRGNIAVLVASMSALALTGSRSSWIAVMIACIVVLFVYLLRGSLAPHWKKGVCIALLAGGIVCIAVAGIFSDRISHFFVHDPTVALRSAAYTETWHRLVEPNMLFGVGYNAYQFSAKSAGLIRDFSIHSRAGSDNSGITLLVTTGIIGTMLFFLPFIVGVYWHGKQWLLHKRGQSLLFLWSLVVIIVHAQFENSLLYPHLLMAFIIIAVATL
ncbi:MAG: O-antigen ligase family protein [Candidatus Andersenbacteria bacterium]|nr:O-antigen ligase family protein [Candidatus Andersenbacteria bacterium]